MAICLICTQAEPVAFAEQGAQKYNKPKCDSSAERNYWMKNTSMKSFGTSNRTGHDSSNFYKRKLFSNQEDHGLRSEQEETPDSVNLIYRHSSESMHELPDNSVHLMVTSPPYNVGKEYDDDLTVEEYLNLLNAVWKETHRVLVPGGRACINIANLGRKPYLPLNAMITLSMIEMGFMMRGEIIWNKSASAGVSCAWGSWRSASNPVLRDTHEYIMVFSKGSYARKSADGKSTIEKEQFLEWTKSIWDMRTESAKKVSHPAPFPAELPDRLIRLYTFQGDTVLDPFMGSGTTAVAAIEAERNYVGYEICEDYIKVALERIRAGQQSLL